MHGWDKSHPTYATYMKRNNYRSATVYSPDFGSYKANEAFKHSIKTGLWRCYNPGDMK